MLKDTFGYAVRGLARRRLRSWLTIIGIFIGIAAVVSLLSLGEGLENAVTSQFSSLGTTSLNIQPEGGGFGPPGLGSAVQLFEDDRRVVERAAGVDAAAGRILRPVSAEFGRDTETTFLASLPEEREQRSVVENFQDPVAAQGRLITADDSKKVHIGGDLAEDFDQPVQIGSKITVQEIQLEVVGILESRGNPATDSAIWINEEDAREILGLEEEFSFIVARAVDEQSVQIAKESIIKDLRKHRDVEERQEDFTVETNEETLRTFQDILAVITGVLAGIAGISLFVGGIGIMNTMYTSVVERTKEIGIMKSIGATPNQIQQLFLIESGLLGAVGGIIGILVGIALSETVELVAAQALGPSVLQASTPLWLILGSLAFSFIVGALSGVFPARKAAALQPTEALR